MRFFDSLAKVAVASAPNTETRASAPEADRTPFSMYPTSEPLTRETATEAPATQARSENVKRPGRTLLDNGDRMYNALGLRTGPISVLSTHRAPQSQRPIALTRQAHEKRAWRGFEAMLSLFKHKR
jgi:hypothetical protein